MDGGIFSRYTMAGWTFLAVLIASMWQSNSRQWQDLNSLLVAKEGTAFPIAIFAAIVGLSAPPALGFVLTTVAVAIWDAVDTRLGQLFRNDREINSRHPAGERPSADISPEELRVRFYSSANERLVAWRLRRQTQAYAAFSSGLAIVLALVVATYLGFGHPIVWIACAPIVVALSWAALRERRVVRSARRTWYALLAADGQLRPLRQTPRRRRRPPARRRSMPAGPTATRRPPATVIA